MAGTRSTKNDHSHSQAARLLYSPHSQDPNRQAIALMTHAFQRSKNLADTGATATLEEDKEIQASMHFIGRLLKRHDAHAINPNKPVYFTATQTSVTPLEHAENHRGDAPELCAVFVKKLQWQAERLDFKKAHPESFQKGGVKPAPKPDHPEPAPPRQIAVEFSDCRDDIVPDIAVHVQSIRELYSGLDAPLSFRNH